MKSLQGKGSIASSEYVFPSEHGACTCRVYSEECEILSSKRVLWYYKSQKKAATAVFTKVELINLLLLSKIQWKYLVSCLNWWDSTPGEHLSPNHSGAKHYFPHIDIMFPYEQVDHSPPVRCIYLLFQWLSRYVVRLSHPCSTLCICIDMEGCTNQKLQKNEDWFVYHYALITVQVICRRRN